jgi:hypothetical protein
MTLLRSDRAEHIRRLDPPSPASWMRPAPVRGDDFEQWRADNAGRQLQTCGCSLGLIECNCAGACELPEPNPAPQKWEASTIAWAITVAIAMAVLACVIPGGGA